MKTQVMNCPFCNSILDVDIDWAIRNERIFCGTCCKSFPVRIGEDTTDKPEPEKVDDVQEKWDKGIKEILEDEEDEPNFDWDFF